jgi:hypothetical protein
MIQPLASLVVIGSLMSSFTTLAAPVTGQGQKSAQPPAIATSKAAAELVHELLDADSSGIGVTPAGCYAVNIATRADGVYVARVSQRAGKTCSIWYERGFRPFSMEIRRANGAVTLIDFLGEPRQIQMFAMQDNPDMPTEQESWVLKGTAKRLADTDQCSLSYATPAFERVNAYSFGLDAQKDTRALTVSYSVNVFGGGPAINKATQAALSLVTEQGKPTSYPATLVPLRLDAPNVQTSNEVFFRLILNERDALAFVDTLAHATRVVPKLDQKEQPHLVLAADGGLTPNFNTSVNAKVAAAFHRCLGVIWK